MFRQSYFKTKHSGLTLLEVILTLSILVVLTFAVSDLLKNSVDLQAGLSEKSSAIHRLNLAMYKVVNDLQHVLYVQQKDLSRQSMSRKIQTIFQLDPGYDFSSLWVTTISHSIKFVSELESDMTYVVYKVLEDKDISGIYNLYRGEAARIPLDFKEEPSLELIAKYIKTFKLEAWNGEDWARDKWDTTKTDYKDKIPHMVKIEIEGYDEEPKSAQSLSSLSTIKLSTIVFITSAIEMPQLKQITTSINWDKL